MRFFKIFLSIFVAFLLSISANAETITFPAGSYDGAVDSKGRANGQGIFIFKNNCVYEGNFSKNKIHKKGKFICDGKTIYEGKTSYGKITIYLPEGSKHYTAKERKIISLKTNTGFSTEYEKKMDARWYEAEEVNGEFQLTAKGQTDYTNDKRSGASTNAGKAGDCGQSWGVGVDGNPL